MPGLALTAADVFLYDLSIAGGTVSAIGCRYKRTDMLLYVAESGLCSVTRRSPYKRPFTPSQVFDNLCMKCAYCFRLTRLRTSFEHER